jgi:adenylyltransferase/sulfurtransferase
MVLGAGAIGNEVIKLLALTGVGQIVIVDFDRIERSNLTRSVLFRDEDVGEPKAETAARRARQINPDIDVRAINGDLEFEVGLGIYRAMNLVVSGLDSVGARLAANRACCRVGVPLLNAGIETEVAEIGLYSGEHGACYECALPDGLWQRQAERFSCTGLRVDLPPDQTPTTAVVASVTAGYLVHAAICLLHSRQDASSGGPVQARLKQKASGAVGLEPGQKLFLTFKPYGLMTVDLSRDPHCLAHERWEPVELVSADPAEITAVDLLEQLGEPEGELELDFDLLTRMRCVRCGATEAIMRPLSRCPAGLTRCRTCMADTRSPETLNRVGAELEFARRPLASLGVAQYQIVSVKHENRRHYVQLTGVYL